MVECMEAWLIADRRAMQEYYGPDFRLGAIPSRRDVEQVAKADVYAALERATHPCGRGKQYDKGGHSFKLLRMCDPAVIRGAGPWAERFFSELERRAGVNCSVKTIRG